MRVTISKSGSEELGRRGDSATWWKLLLSARGELSGVANGLLCGDASGLVRLALWGRAGLWRLSKSVDDTDPGGSGWSSGSLRRFQPALTARFKNEPGLVISGLGRGLGVGLMVPLRCGVLGLAGAMVECGARGRRRKARRGRRFRVSEVSVVKRAWFRVP